LLPRKVRFMIEPQDAIRPRHRRRPLSVTANPAIARAELSTRILIRVPAAAISPTATTGQTLGAKSSSPSARIQTKSELKPASTGLSGLKSLLDETTAKSAASSREGSAIREQNARLRHAQLGVQPTPESAPQSATAAIDTKTHFRLDGAHAETPGPHSAAASWLEARGRGLIDLVLRSSLIAVVLIIAGAISVAVMLHSRTQHHAIRTDGEPGANASGSNLDKNVRYPETTAGPIGLNNQNSAGNAAGFAQGSIASSGNASGQQSMGGTMPRQNGMPSAPQYRTAEPPRGGISPAASPSPWKVPSGANMPARVEPVGTVSQPIGAPSAPSLDAGTIYSAQRGNIPAAGSPGGMSSGSAMGAARFDGGINNPSLQFSR
jgi:hypothetical protein